MIKKLTCLLFLMLASPLVSACGVCFGNPDDPQTKGVGAAIITLLIVTYMLIASMIAFLIFTIRRARKQKLAQTAEI